MLKQKSLYLIYRRKDKNSHDRSQINYSNQGLIKKGKMLLSGIMKNNWLKNS